MAGVVSALTFDAPVTFDSPFYGFDGASAVALEPDSVLDVDLPSFLALMIDGDVEVDLMSTVTVDEPVITGTDRESVLVLDV